MLQCTAVRVSIFTKCLLCLLLVSGATLPAHEFKK